MASQCVLAISTLAQWKAVDVPTTYPFESAAESSASEGDDAEDVMDALMKTRTDEFIRLVRADLEQAAKLANRSVVAAPTDVAAPQQSQVLAKMRSLVSQEKVRFQLDGFDLDLTYITPRVIAMGFPSYGKEAYYRNPAEEVERFFNTRHSGHYRIYNLCSERDYDAPTRFNGNYRRFPFDDHNAPCPIKVIPDFVRDAMEFMQQHPDNVVAVHCKAGKGRTGVMISCLLRALEPNKIKNADAALEYFGNVRTADGKGVTIPSQKRYVRYWDLMMQHFQGREPPPRVVQMQSVKVESSIKVSGAVELYFTVEENNKEKMDSRRYFPSGPRRDHEGHLLFAFREPFPTMTGDLRIIFYQRNALFADEELFHLWVNTSLCQAVERFTKADESLDGRPAKSKDLVFAPTLAVELHFGGTYVRPSAPTSTTAAAATTATATASTVSEDRDSTPRLPSTKEKGFFKRMFAAEME